MANVRQRWTKLLGPIKREFLALKDSEIDELYAGFMSIDGTEAPSARSGWAGGASKLPAHGEPSAEEVAELLTTTHTKMTDGSAKPDFYSFCNLFSETKGRNKTFFEEDLKKVAEWGRARAEARAEEAAQALVLKARKKKSAREAAEEEKLDEFIRQSERCWNCKAFYSEDENHDKACSWHPGPRKQHTSNQNHLDRVLYQCCGAEQIGTQPILIKAKPCTVSRHMTKEQAEAAQAKTPQ